MIEEVKGANCKFLLTQVSEVAVDSGLCDFDGDAETVIFTQ